MITAYNNYWDGTTLRSTNGGQSGYLLMGQDGGTTTFSVNLDETIFSQGDDILSGGTSAVRMNLKGKGLAINSDNPDATLDLAPKDSSAILIDTPDDGTAATLNYRTASNYVLGLRVSPIMTESYTLTYPSNLPSSSNSSLVSDLAGNLRWAAATNSWGLSGNAISNGDVFGTTNAQDLHIQAGGVTAVTISKTTQNMGVGTTVPSSKLEVKGSVAKAIKFINTGGSVTLDETHSTLIFHATGSSDILDVELPDPSTCIGRIYHFTHVDPSQGAILNINAPAGFLIYMRDSNGRTTESFPSSAAFPIPVGCTLVANDTGWYAISSWVGDPGMNGM